MMRSSNIIVVENVTKVYGKGDLAFTALDNVSLRIKKGEFVSVIGPSGSGKTTLMDILGTLDSPTSGKLFIDGIDSSKMTQKELAILRNRKIGFVFQSFNLVQYLTVRENIRLPLMVSGKDEEEKLERALDLLERFGVPKDHFDMLPNKLSQGQQQRVAVARALSNNPPILLADEPTGNLDSVSSDAVMKIFSDLVKELKTTVVMVTHDMHVASYAMRYIQLRDGKIEKEGIFNRGRW